MGILILGVGLATWGPEKEGGRASAGSGNRQRVGGRLQIVWKPLSRFEEKRRLRGMGKKTTNGRKEVKSGGCSLSDLLGLLNRNSQDSRKKVPSKRKAGNGEKEGH